MNSLMLEKRLKREINSNAIKDTRNIFKQKKENETIRDRIIRNIRNLFVQEIEDYYKPVRIGNIWNRNYIELESNRDRNKILLIKVFLIKIRPYLKYTLLKI